MNIIEYEKKYKEEVKKLLVELQEYIVSIDKEGYNIISDGYGEVCFKKMIRKVKNNNGKIYLAETDGSIIGMISCIINNEETSEYDFKSPKRGRVIEFIVTRNNRQGGVGKLLLEYAELYLKNEGCKAILIEVFAYNEIGKNFYYKNKYNDRGIDLMRLI